MSLRFDFGGIDFDHALKDMIIERYRAKHKWNLEYLQMIENVILTKTEGLKLEVCPDRRENFTREEFEKNQKA